MADEQGPVEELADKTSRIVVAGIHETWPYRKLMLAVLPPTVALLIAVIGMWESSNRDRAAAEQAEKDRAVEVAKEQAVALKEQRLREAELVLPRYEQLLADVRNTRNHVDRCLIELKSYIQAFPGVILQADGTLVPAGPAPPPVDSIDPNSLVPLQVDPDVVTSCSAIDETIDPLGLSLDKALLVSNLSLSSASVELTAQLKTVREQARTILDKVNDETYEILIDPSGTYFADGTSTAAALSNLNNVLANIEPASQRVIDAVRGVVLELD